MFEQHQALRASRTVLRQRAVSLRDASPAEIPDKAGTAALLPRHSDIQVAVSADYDIGSGLTFAFGYEIFYFDEVRDDSGQPKSIAKRIKRPMLVEQRKVEEEGNIFCQWLGHLAQPSAPRGPLQSGVNVAVRLTVSLPGFPTACEIKFR